MKKCEKLMYISNFVVQLSLVTDVDQILDIFVSMHDFNASLTTKTNDIIAKEREN